MQSKPKILIYRILGNDLPPRHQQGQTLANLRFILQHEHLIRGVERRWILNRIWDRSVQEKLAKLLSDDGEDYQCIQFDIDHYKQQHLDARGLPKKFNPLIVLNSSPTKYEEFL